MVRFITNRIIKAKTISIEKAWAKYSAYFINTKMYAKYRTDVDAMLFEKGYCDCVVQEVVDNEN